MTENELGFLSSIELQRKDYKKNVIKPLKTPIITERNTATFVISGVATGAGSIIAVRLEGIDVLINPNPGDTAVDTATALQGQLVLDLAASYGANQYSVTKPTTTSVRVTKLNGNELWVEDDASTDATQNITQNQGVRSQTALLLEATAAGTGLPFRFEDGFFVESDIPTAERNSGMVLHIMLKNLTGGAVTARWRLWVWWDYLGWTLQQTNSITESTGLGIQEATSAFTAFRGPTKIAVELLDDGTIGNSLPSGAALTILGINAN